MTDPQVPNPAAPPAVGGRSSSALWAAIAAILILAGVVAVVASRGSSGDQRNDAQVQTGADTVTDGSAESEEPGGSEEPSTTEAGPQELPADALPVYDATADEDPAIGLPMPTVTGETYGGDALTLGPDGQAKVILFVAHWCPHCQDEVPLLKAHLDDHPMPDDVALYTVSTAVRPGATNYPPQDWLDAEGWSAPVLADDDNSTAAQTFGLSAFPYFVAVDAEGKVVYRATGELSTDEFDDAVKAAQEGS